MKVQQFSTIFSDRKFYCANTRTVIFSKGAEILIRYCFSMGWGIFMDCRVAPDAKAFDTG